VCMLGRGSICSVVGFVVASECVKELVCFFVGDIVLWLFVCAMLERVVSVCNACNVCVCQRVCGFASLALVCHVRIVCLFVCRDREARRQAACRALQGQ
jgi:hypothetical protein